jgi:arabinose-5-phosphate isomerase
MLRASGVVGYAAGMSSEMRKPAGESVGGIDLDFARGVIDAEGQAVLRMRDAVGEEFARAVRMILDAQGSLVTSGIGKAGHVARKLSATFASTGTPSHFLSPADALHGDVGSVRDGDVILLLSASGESEEIVRLLSILRRLGRKIISITATRSSSLGRESDVALLMGRIEEACPLGLAPSASTTAMLALGDALALTVMKHRDFTSEQFAIFHPAGQLGRRMMKVGEAMSFRQGENLPVASDRLRVGEVLSSVSRIRRRSGAVILVDDAGVLSGFFSDGDLRRLIERDPSGAMSTPIASVMTKNPKRIHVEALASRAMAVLREYRIDELPVVDDADRPVGLIDVQDLVLLKMLDVER